MTRRVHGPPRHPLASPKFTDRERAAWDWLHNHNIRPWLVDLLNKQVTTPKRVWPNIIDFAHHMGWDG